MLDSTTSPKGDAVLEAAALSSLDQSCLDQGMGPYGLSTASPFASGLGTDVIGLNPGLNSDEATLFDPQRAVENDPVSDLLTGLATTLADDFAGSTATRGVLGIGNTLSGSLEKQGDRDWLRLNLTAGETYQFRMNRNSLSDPLLNLRNSKGGLLASDDDGGGNLNSLITYRAKTSGVHFLDAGAYANKGLGTYTVSAFRSVDDFAASTSTTGALTAGSSITGNLETIRDHDWFRISLTAGQNYAFRLDAGSLSNPFLNLRNSAGTLLSSNDDSSSSTRNSLIRFSATASGLYYLDAGANADALTGSYVLSAAIDTGSTPSNYSSLDGYGEASAQRAIETLLGRSLTAQTNLNGVFWGLDRIGAPEVWAAGITGQGVTVAVVDTGVDYNHVDLDANIWSNSGEIAGNGIDDDSNGFIDDIRGWDFIGNDNNPMDENIHGTHVAGSIAAENNGIGQTGVAFNARIMPVRVLDAQGSGSNLGVANGIRYAANNGAQVINLSLGGSSASSLLLDAIRYATSRGSVVVMAAGNDGSANPGYPGAYANEVGIAVGAVDSSGALAGFSNRSGLTTKDYVTAAGVSIYSTLPGNQYGYLSGTSMATPHVAGAVALIRSYAPSLSAAQVETLVATSASHGGGAAAFGPTTTTSSGTSNALQLAGHAKAHPINLDNSDESGDTANRSNPVPQTLPMQGSSPESSVSLASSAITSRAMASSSLSAAAHDDAPFANDPFAMASETNAERLGLGLGLGDNGGRFRQSSVTADRLTGLAEVDANPLAWPWLLWHS